MNLIIKQNLNWQKDPLLFKYFIQEYLIPEIYLCLAYDLNHNKFQTYKWDMYLKEHYKEIPNPNTRNILFQGISSLQCKSYNNYYLIQMDPNQIIPGTSDKLYDVCEMINSGTLDVSPYPIFNKIFKCFSNINTLQKMFDSFLYDLGLDLEEEI